MDLKWLILTQNVKDFQVQQEISNVKIGPLPTDCQGTFTPECQKKIKAESKEIGIIQCWGKPLYAYCKASDGTVFHIPGYDCEHSTCSNDTKAQKNPDIPIQTGKTIKYRHPNTFLHSRKPLQWQPG